MLMAKRLIFQFNDHTAMQDAIVENKIGIVVFIVNNNSFLTGFKAESFTHFQQKLLKVIHQGLFQITFFNRKSIIQAKKLQSQRLSYRKHGRRLIGLYIFKKQLRFFTYPGAEIYEHGKLYYDADYVKQTEFYLGDLLNSENVNEIQAEKRYKDAFPSNFEEGFDQLMRQNGDTRQSIADKLHMEKRTLDRWLADPDRFISIDFLTILCLTWKIPDWLSPVLFDRAHRSLSESDPRHASILFILRAMFGDGLEAANDYLVKRKHKPLSIA